MKLLVPAEIVHRAKFRFGGSVVANSVRPWTSDDLEKLKAMAGNHRRDEIAAELNRGVSSVAVKAHQLGISLRYHGLPKRRPTTAQSAAGH